MATNTTNNTIDVATNEQAKQLAKQSAKRQAVKTDTSPGKRSANPTVKDVAALAKVAVSTASAVLREDDTCYASAATREKVTDAARKLGYRPNRFARALRGKTSYTLGLLFESLAAPSITLAKLAPIEQLAWDAGYRVIVGNYYNSPQRQRDHIKEFIANRVDGLILVTADPSNADAIQDLMKQNVPLVTIDSIYDFPTPDVWVDRVAGGRLQVEHLLDIGKKRIAFLTSTLTTGLAPKKLQGYREALAARGSSMDEHLLVDLTSLKPTDRFSFGRKVVEDLLAKGETFDAIVLSADSLALGVYQALQQAGLRIPEDVAVMGFDDEDYARALSPALSTIRQPRDVGEKAVAMLLEQIKNKNEPQAATPSDVCLVPTLVVRESTSEDKSKR